MAQSFIQGCDTDNVREGCVNRQFFDELVDEKLEQGFVITAPYNQKLLGKFEEVFGKSHISSNTVLECAVVKLTSTCVQTPVLLGLRKLVNVGIDDVSTACKDSSSSLALLLMRCGGVFIGRINLHDKAFQVESVRNPLISIGRSLVRQCTYQLFGVCSTKVNFKLNLTEVLQSLHKYPLYFGGTGRVSTHVAI